MSLEANGRTAALRTQLQAAAQDFAQAKADLTLLN
jgi:hypothetical protein